MPPVDLEFYSSCTLDQDGCTTCGDVAVPVYVVKVEGCEALVEDRLGQQASVATDLFPDLQIGDVLLVHMGVAIHRLPRPSSAQEEP